ncbi:hypothetical protein K7X08_010515 [Anisodus acutangulus]|uniref:Uncharacterized protein n=1 Tax=Anisodus acutangulus TaxID=402998 RepID=A0A9Q1N1H9_9SOLA|nr:hypothetical protein K7X08_010515 [Anisodus acutangulus]
MVRGGIQDCRLEFYLVEKWFIDGKPINGNVDEQTIQTRNTFAALIEDNEIPEKNDKTEVTNETDYSLEASTYFVEKNGNNKEQVEMEYIGREGM